MNKKIGFVENTSRDGKRIQVDGTWFSAFASTQLGGATKGDYVEFAYTEKASTTPGADPFRNIKGEVRKSTPPASTPMTGAGVMAGAKASTGGGGGFVQKQFPVPAFHPDRSIIRQNSLTHACNVIYSNQLDDEGVSRYGSVEAYADAVINIARRFEAYSCGDLDVEMVDEEMRKLIARE